MYNCTLSIHLDTFKNISQKCEIIFILVIEITKSMKYDHKMLIKANFC